MAELSREFDIRRSNGDSVVDQVAAEEPLEIQIVSSGADGAAAKSVSITMRTPGNDAELALGFLFTEGILSSADQVVDVTAVGEPAPDSGEQRAYP